MVAAEAHVSVLTDCGARLFPNWNTETVSDVPAGTDLRVLRDEDLDFIKVAYEGKPVYVPRTAVTPPSVLAPPDRIVLQRFVLRRDSDLTLTAVATLASLLPFAPILLFLMPAVFRSRLGELLVTAGVVIAISVGFWLFARSRQASVGVCDDALVLSNVRKSVIVLEQIDSINEARLNVRGIIGIQIGIFVPWTDKTLTLHPYPSRRMLQLTLSKGLSFGWGPLSVRYARVLFDPEDRAGFLKLLKQVAPHVRIDSTLLAKYGA